MRIPIVPDISSRDGSSAKNGRMYNVLGEKRPNGDRFAAVRPGLTQAASTTGSGKGLVCWNGTLVAMYGTTAKVLGDGVSNEIAGLIADPSTTWISNWNGFIAWNGTVFCAGPSTVPGNTAQLCVTSSDGNTWTKRTVNAVWWGSPFAVVVKKNDTTLLGIAPNNHRSFLSTDDGVSWSITNMGTALSTYKQAAANSSIYVVVSITGSNSATSTNGTTWTERTTPNTFRNLCVQGERFIAICFGSANAAYSDDGIAWTTTTLPSSTTWQHIVATDNYILANDGAGVAALSSDNGLTWSSATIPSGYSTCAASPDVFVLIKSGFVAVSADGNTWSEFSISTSPSPGFRGGIYGNGKFCFISLNGETVTFTIGPNLSSISTVSGSFFDFAQSPT